MGRGRGEGFDVNLVCGEIACVGQESLLTHHSIGSPFNMMLSVIVMVSLSEEEVIPSKSAISTTPFRNLLTL